MEELKELWQGVYAYGSHLKCQFSLHVAYLWFIHDYLAYGKFADWCLHGRLNYPIYMDDSDAFRHDKKVTFFECHRSFLPLSHPIRSDKRSFFKGKSVRKGPPKQKLEVGIKNMLDDLKESKNGEFDDYPKALILPQNNDLMHQECNIVESITSMCLDVTSFMKDNMNAKIDLAALFDCPSLKAKSNAKINLSRPRAPYCLKPKERTKILKWLKPLKFPNRYAANIK
jgi:hypothetical protein